MKKFSPTTPSRRQMTVVDYSVLSDAKPYRRLLTNVAASAGRNNAGRITTRHQGGGNKKRYRLVDFRQERMDVPARIETLEYDPYRTAFIALILYKDGVRSYIIAPNGLVVGDKIITSINSPVLKPGNRTALKNIPVGYQVHNVELIKGKGGQIARSAGSYLEVLAQEDGHTSLKMSSGEMRKVNWECLASIGQVSNPDWNLVNIGKAGRSRWLGIRPTVRGSAMNPVDHPYGGGEGRQRRGTRKPKTAWGKVTGGHKTRKRKKWSNVLILERRKKK